VIKTIVKSLCSPHKVIILCLSALTALCGCATDVGKVLSPADIQTMNIQNENQPYYLGAGDTIGIKFFYNPELNDEVTIRPDGKISLHLIGDITAAGITPELLTSNLKSKYAEILRFSKETYILGSGDKIGIKFFYDPKLNDEVIIRPDGKISLQLIGDITAAGLTPYQLTSILKRKYANVLKSPELAVIVREFKDPELTVTVEDFASQKIYVGGEVTKPGHIPMKGMVRTLDAVITAGGALDTARFDNILLIRYNGSEKADLYSVNLERIISGEVPDIVLRPYDIVYLPKKTITKVSLFVRQYLYDFIPNNVFFGFSYIVNPGALR